MLAGLVETSSADSNISLWLFSSKYFVHVVSYDYQLKLNWNM
jgi:hypothetical protein